MGLRVLIREAAFGAMLWSSVPGQAGAMLPAYVVGLGAVILWTRWFGLLRPRRWSTAVREGLLLQIGAICFANFVWLCFGNAPWWR